MINGIILDNNKHEMQQYTELVLLYPQLEIQLNMLNE